jgi:hypothetical protein
MTPNEALTLPLTLTRAPPKSLSMPGPVLGAANLTQPIVYSETDPAIKAAKIERSLYL